MKAKGKGLITQGLIPDWLDKIFLDSVSPLIKLFSSIKLNPNWITVLGFIQNAVAAVFIVYEKFLIGGLFIVLAGIFDFIDGKVAVRMKRTSTFGAVLDSTLDRYSDIVIYFGIILYYQKNHFDIALVVTVLALVGSVMTSYIKAIGESYGIKFRAGALRRQERITLICIGLILTFLNTWMGKAVSDIAAFIGMPLGEIPVMPLTLIIYILAFLTNFSAIQRFGILRKITKSKDRPLPEPAKNMRSEIKDRKLKSKKG